MKTNIKKALLQCGLKLAEHDPEGPMDPISNASCICEAYSNIRGHYFRKEWMVSEAIMFAPPSRAGLMSTDVTHNGRPYLFYPHTHVWWGILTSGKNADHIDNMNERILAIAFMVFMPAEIRDGLCHPGNEGGES